MIQRKANILTIVKKPFSQITINVRFIFHARIEL